MVGIIPKMVRRVILGVLVIGVVGIFAVETSFFADTWRLMSLTFAPSIVPLASIEASTSTPTSSIRIPTQTPPIIATVATAIITPPTTAPTNAAHPLVSEVMVGSKEDAKDEFIELYNPEDRRINLTGYSIRKRSSTGSESSLVSAARLNGKSIPPDGYFLIAGGGYDGPVVADVTWPASYTLSAKNNAIIVYNQSGVAVQEVAWQILPVGYSLVRPDWSANAFNISATPTPQNTQGQ